MSVLCSDPVMLLQPLGVRSCTCFKPQLHKTEVARGKSVVFYLLFVRAPVHLSV